MGLQVIQEVGGPPQILCDACARVYEASADLLEHGVCPSDDCPSNSFEAADAAISSDHSFLYYVKMRSECAMAWPGDEPHSLSIRMSKSNDEAFKRFEVPLHSDALGVLESSAVGALRQYYSDRPIRPRLSPTNAVREAINKATEEEIDLSALGWRKPR